MPFDKLQITDDFALLTLSDYCSSCSDFNMHERRDCDVTEQTTAQELRGKIFIFSVVVNHNQI